MKRYYTIDHRVLFLFGYLFYFFTPYVVGQLDLFATLPGMELFHGYYKQISSESLSVYLIITLTWLPAFYLGHLAFKFIKPYKKSLQLFPPTSITKKMWVEGVLLFCILFVFIVIGRNSILGGYSSYDVGARGKFSTLLVIFNFFLVYQLLSKETSSFIFAIGPGLTALLLLSMGGRMYVIQTFVIYLVYKTSFAEKRWKVSKILIVSFLAFLVGSSIGLWRMHSNFGLEKALYSLFAEPVFTWFSTSTFFLKNEVPILNFPTNFLTSFLNLVPNSLIGIKRYIISVKQMGYEYENPLGADSIWTTLVINFGAIGSFFFIFITGFLLNFLRHLSEDSRFWAVYYILVCGIIPFQIFRDGFFIINKQLFFNFLLFPAIVIMLLKLLEYSQSRTSRRTEIDNTSGAEAHS